MNPHRFISKGMNGHVSKRTRHTQKRGDWARKQEKGLHRFHMREVPGRATAVPTMVRGKGD